VRDEEPPTLGVAEDTEMEWIIPVVLQVAMEILAGLAQMHDHRSEIKARNHPPVPEDNWRCPDAAEFNRIFGRAGVLASDRRNVPDLGVSLGTEETRFDRLSQSASQHPLWDRALDG
jgi:hypothetical protein